MPVAEEVYSNVVEEIHLYLWLKRLHLVEEVYSYFWLKTRRKV